MTKKAMKVFKFLHLWLGLLSGIVVVIVCLTGSIFTFKDEISDISQPWRFIELENKEFVAPSELLQKAEDASGLKQPSAITFKGRYEAVVVDFYKSGVFTSVYMNPYNADVINIGNKRPKFFCFIIEGHRQLWLPREIGKPIVGYSILIFLITLITGFILWFPKKGNLKKKLKLKLKGSLSSINYSLHNSLGIYAFIFLIVLSITGLIRSFDWFSEFVYFSTSGGEKLEKYTLPKSDTLNLMQGEVIPIDELYKNISTNETDLKSLYIYLPAQPEDVFRVSLLHSSFLYSKTDNLFYDQKSLVELEGGGPYGGRFDEASGANKLRRMNLDIHSGSFLGIFGKILVALASLIGASLPITGFIIWYRKGRANRKRIIQKV